MSVVAFHEDRVMFGVNIPEHVNACLQQAVAAYDDSERAESLLWEAQRLDPNQLEVYVALYKFYFYKNRIDEAEDVVFMALNRSEKSYLVIDGLVESRSTATFVFICIESAKFYSAQAGRCGRCGKYFNEIT